VPINKSISNLPRADRPEGNLPSRNNFVAERIANHWAKLDEHTKPPLAVPEAGAYRGSFAGKRCDRALFYAMRGDEPTNPPTIADRWRMGLGTTVHEMLQQIAGDLFNSDDEADFANAQSEVKVDLRPIGVPGSSNLDFLFEYRGKLCAVEIKTKNGFGFKMAATNFKGAAEGPRYSDVLQGGMAAKALGAELLVVCYLSMENISPQMASTFSETEAGRFAAEWHYTVVEVDDYIAAEVARIERITEAVSVDVMPKRTIVDPEYPDGAEINAPDQKNGMWVLLDDDGGVEDSGSTWFCAYCDQRDQCISDGR
jgi:hypothetical protein